MQKAASETPWSPPLALTPSRSAVGPLLGTWVCPQSNESSLHDLLLFPSTVRRLELGEEPCLGRLSDGQGPARAVLTPSRRESQPLLGQAACILPPDRSWPGVVSAWGSRRRGREERGWYVCTWGGGEPLLVLDRALLLTLSSCFPPLLCLCLKGLQLGQGPPHLMFLGLSRAGEGLVQCGSPLPGDSRGA